MSKQAKMKLADRLARAVGQEIISMEEADQVWIRQTSEPVAWEQEYL